MLPVDGELGRVDFAIQAVERLTKIASCEGL